MDFTTTVPIPAEPSGLTLFVTGLLAIAVYLTLTGQLHLLRPRKVGSAIPCQTPTAPAGLAIIRPRKSKYDLCNYDSQLAHSLAKIMRVAVQLDKDAVIKCPSEMVTAQLITGYD